MKNRLLLMDDESAILFAYRKFFQHQGIAVDTVETRGEALNLLRQNTYLAVILDLSLCGSNGEEGFELIDVVKGHYYRTKIIIVTACGSPEIEARAYRLGADCYFEKPVSTGIIRDKLKDLGFPMEIVDNRQEIG
ncbi:MAG: response regulator [Gemmatimonadota bacterium]|nr:response regulator [Gemmatimonadota bacterium]